MATDKTKESVTKTPAAAPQQKNRVNLTPINGNATWLDTTTMRFVVQVGGETIERKSVDELTAAVQRLAESTHAIVLGRRVRDVLITGRVGDKMKLSGGESIARSSDALVYNADVLKQLKAVETKRINAEETYNKIMQETQAQMEEIIKGSAKIDFDALPEITTRSRKGADAGLAATENSDDEIQGDAGDGSDADDFSPATIE